MPPSGGIVGGIFSATVAVGDHKRTDNVIVGVDGYRAAELHVTLKGRRVVVGNHLVGHLTLSGSVAPTVMPCGY